MGGFRRDVLHGADRRGAGAPRPGPGPVERAPGVHGRGSGRGPARPVPVRLQPALRRSGRIAGHGRGGHRRSGHPSPGDGTQRRGRASSAIGVPSATEDPEPQRAPCRQVPCRSTAGLEFERAPRRGVIGTDDETLARALRLAADPPGGISIEALQDLVRDDDPPPPGASAPRQPTGVSPRALRHYERPGLIAVARDRAGRRTCDAAAVRRVVLLARMRTSGAPIAGLRRCVELVDAGSAPWPNVSTCS
ncbi:MAG: MerR family transcriptional regulator [Propionibacterium acidifaciens]|uniref:MerR family transcriptional regulator n=1 Tax=Propionibacterium acidifaciens TaxID=556499 RepID=UPI00361951F9